MTCKLRLHSLNNQMQRLTLVLDLDHTILHSNAFYGHVTNKSLNECNLVQVQKQPLLIKFRPGLDKFLQTLHEKYDLYIYTMGEREYATAVLSIIDPKNILFNNRIIARDDFKDHKFKCLSNISPTIDETKVVVVDDYVDIWKTHSKQVVRVLQYQYFTDKGQVENDDGTVLHSLAKILLKIHHIYFTTSFITTTAIVQQVKLQVLHGCKILFSGVTTSTNGLGLNKQTREWEIAEELGALCYDEEDGIFSNFTHVLTSNKHVNCTSKVKKAIKYNDLIHDCEYIPPIHIVSTNWLYASLVHYRKAKEKHYVPYCVKNYHYIRKTITSLVSS